MVGPFYEVNREIPVSAAFTQFHKRMWKPLAPPGGRSWIPPSSGISGSPRKQVNDPRFSFRENFLGLITKESSET